MKYHEYGLCFWGNSSDQNILYKQYLKKKEALLKRYGKKNLSSNATNFKRASNSAV